MKSREIGMVQMINTNFVFEIQKFDLNYSKHRNAREVKFDALIGPIRASTRRQVPAASMRNSFQKMVPAGKLDERTSKIQMSRRVPESSG